MSLEATNSKVSPPIFRVVGAQCPDRFVFLARAASRGVNFSSNYASSLEINEDLSTLPIRWP
jgi:hypothetical protein